MLTHTLVFSIVYSPMCTVHVHAQSFDHTASKKKVHHLSVVALQPESIEKTSVKLATAIFSEPTRDALQFYASNKNKPDWIGTANFISLIIKLWNAMNVKTHPTITTRQRPTD